MDPISTPHLIPEFYDRAFPDAQEGENHLYAAALSGVAHPARVLDLGCGTGRLARVLRAAAPGARLVSCDLQPAWLRRAARRGIGDLVCADARALPFPDASFAACVSGLLVMNYLGSADAFALALREAARVLAPHGVFVADLLCTHKPTRLQGIRESFVPDDDADASFAFEFYDVLGEDTRGAVLASAMILGAEGRVATERADVFVPSIGALPRLLEEAGLKLEWFAPPYEFAERTLTPPPDTLRAVVCARR